MNFEEKDVSQMTEEDIKNLQTRYKNLIENRNKQIKIEFELNLKIQKLEERIKYLEQELHSRISDVR